MSKKLAIILLAVASVLTAVGAVDRASSEAGPDLDSRVAVATLDPVTGRQPLPEIIELWRGKVEGQPLDYLNRTRLGNALNALGSETAEPAHYTEAAVVFGQALDANPSHAPARLGLAGSLIAQHDFAAAIDQLERAEADGSARLPTLALVGDANLGIGNYQEAAAAYEALIAGERSAPTVSRLARLRWFQGRPAAAVSLAEEALALSGDLAIRPVDRAFYPFQLGHFLFVAGEVDEAIAQYRAALDLAPDHPGAAEALPFALAANGELDQAAERYAELVPEAGAADLHGLYAGVLRALGDETGAAVQERLGTEAALAGIDEHPAERRHIVQFLTARDPALAVELARADLAERADVGAYDHLAWALYHAGRSGEALAMIETALGFGTVDAALFYHAAEINLAAGDTAVAAAYVESSLAVNPHFHPTEADAAAALAARLGVEQPD
ncbi:MAG: tetratricopeptide repeat protein [Actinomycetota bacterium]